MSEKTDKPQQDEPARPDETPQAREPEALTEGRTAGEAGLASETQASADAQSGGEASAAVAREAESTEKARPSSGRGVGFLGILLALVAIGGVAWHWHDTRGRLDDLRETVARKLAESEQQSKDAAALAREIRQSGADVQSRLSALEGKLADSQSQRIALEQLYQDLSRNRDEWAFAEIEQSLLIANQQLQLAGNAKAALIALQNADSRLQRLDRPQLAGLRKAIARDIERLQELPHVDVSGMSARIENLIARVDELPFVADARPPEASTAPPAREGLAGAWDRFWRKAVSEVKELIRVQRVDRQDLPLLAPEQRYFLRENLKLRLLGARVSLLARDEKAFRDDLEAARAWLQQYFDTKSPPVSQALTTLRNLGSTEINIEMPDISASLDALRSLRQREPGVR